MRAARRLFGLTVLATLAVLPPESLDAQIRMRNSEAQLLRDAAARESRGDYAGAAEVLQGLLDENPASSGGLFALERVLRAQGDVLPILPSIDAFLERNPESSGVRSLELRVLAEADSLDALRRESEAWLTVDPSSEVPYREVSRVYDRALDHDEALDVLRRGRTSLGDPEALALEIGDLLAVRGDVSDAADEWAIAVGDDAGQVATVTRRVQNLEQGADEAGRRVVERLSDSEVPARRRAAARVAIDLGLDDQAMTLVRDVSGDLDGRARTTFLADAARRARDADLVDVAAWAYDELGEDAATPAERRQFDQRILDVALAAGDTAEALEAQRRLVDSFTPGSVDRRRATAQVIRLEGARSDPDELREMLADFRAEFPNAPELDDLAATVAGALQRRGDPQGAAAVLDGINGPKSSLERGYLLLAASEIEEGRSALLLALTGLDPAEATPVIEFATLLGRVSEPAAVALAEAGVAAHRGQAADAATSLAEAVPSFEPEEQARILAQAARMASDGGEPGVAAEIRRTLIEEHPDAPEMGEAALALARFRARTPDGVPDAIRLLEDLITRRPNAAVVPDARLELQKLRGTGTR